MWQPIETVPGTYVIGWSESHEFNIIDGGHHITLLDGGREFFNGDVFVTATHWHPLPEPPK